jgi:hypothetical protein
VSSDVFVVFLVVEKEFELKLSHFDDLYHFELELVILSS